MKKIMMFIFILSFFLVSISFISCLKKKDDASANEDTLKVVYMVGGNLGDLSFFDSAQNGMKILKEKYGDEITTKTVEGTQDDTKWLPTLEDLSEQDWDVIITVSATMTEMVTDISGRYPDKKYILVDGVVGNNNVYSIIFKQNEGAFLAGALAAKVTASDDGITNPDKKIGFLGGLDIPVINDFLVGYIEGAKYVDPETKILFSYAGTFEDAAKGKELALVQYNQGVDIGFNVAGGTGLGQLDAAKETGNYAIGVDSDQAMLFESSDAEKSKLIVTSVLKRVDNAIVRAIGKHIEGTLPYGSAEYLGFAEDAIGLAENKYYENAISADIREYVDGVKKKVASGEINVSTVYGDSKISQERLQEIKDSAQ